MVITQGDLYNRLGFGSYNNRYLCAFGDIPMRSKKDPSYSPLQNLENDLHSVVAYFVLPVFAFANAGINLRGLNADQLLHSAPVGIALGLVIGKQLGIFSLCFIAVKSGLTTLPKGMTFTRLYGTAALCGIGFTMSLFIGGRPMDRNT